MRVGTKSLLFGVHAFWWHPLTVLMAWEDLYSPPTWQELICIIIHDVGYWGCSTMDGPDGDSHSERGARWASRMFPKTPYYHGLVLWHSRYYAARHGNVPSKLCWPDKLSMMYDPMWFYLLRARLSGEINEYLANSIKRGFCPPGTTQKEWLIKLREHLAEMSKEEARWHA